MNTSRCLIDIFIIYAIHILCSISVDITININITLVLDIAVIVFSYNFFYRTPALYIIFKLFSISIRLTLRPFFSFSLFNINSIFLKHFSL